MHDDFAVLKLENQLCFPLYACSKEIVKRYTPLLAPLDLTYTQYLVMLVLWEKKALTVKALGECLYLDSGTLTPVLKRLETKGYLSRQRALEDERSVTITITPSGQALQAQAIEIPRKLSACVQLTSQEAATLHTLLYQILHGLEASSAPLEESL